MLQTAVELLKADHGHGQQLLRVRVVQLGLLPDEGVDSCEEFCNIIYEGVDSCEEICSTVKPLN